MGVIQDAFSLAFRDYVVDGNPGSGNNKPIKSEARALGGTIETEISALALQSPIGRHTLPLFAARRMIPQTTNGPALVTTEGATNRTMDQTLDFDASTIEYAQFDHVFPKSWNKLSVTFQAYWSALIDAGSGVVWTLEAKALSDNDVLDSAWGTGVNVTDTVLAASREHISPESAALTIGGGPVDFDRIIFRISRKATDASDTLTGDAKLRGVVIYFTTDAATDA